MQKGISRRTFLSLAGAAAASTLLNGCSRSFFTAAPHRRAEAGRPNFIVIFVDDTGYGDLGCC